MKHILKFAGFLLLSVFVMMNAQAQPSNKTTGGQIINTVTTAVPFLRIAPDARSGAMGEMSMGATPDANGWFFNPAKMAFVDNNLGFSVTYTPWLKQLVNDIYLADLSGFYKIDDIQTVGGSLRYFSLGNIQFTNAQGQFIQDFRPNEFAIDGGYARKLSDYFSSGIMLRFIYSNLATGQQVNGVDIKPGTSVAADIGFHYQNNDLKVSGKDAELGAGINFSNIGAKITYTADAANKDFLPANMALGAALNVHIDDYNQIMVGLDINKLLVPTPDSTGTFKDKSVPSAIFGSFTDAPGGFTEELHEFIYSLGLEYWYDEQFAIRAGYFYEHPTKGNRNFVTVGLGLKYNVFGLNFSYLIPTSNQRNPLDNTLRFSLLFDFDALTNGNGQ